MGVDQGLLILGRQFSDNEGKSPKLCLLTCRGNAFHGQYERCLPGPIGFHGVVGLSVAAHVGRRVDTTNCSSKGHQAPAAVLPHLPVDQVTC